VHDELIATTIRIHQQSRSAPSGLHLSQKAFDFAERIKPHDHDLPPLIEPYGVGREPRPPWLPCQKPGSKSTRDPWRVGAETRSLQPCRDCLTARLAASKLRPSDRCHGVSACVTDVQEIRADQVRRETALVTDPARLRCKRSALSVHSRHRARPLSFLSRPDTRRCQRRVITRSSSPLLTAMRRLATIAIEPSSHQILCLSDTTRSR
jgi:hypothetical protein